MSTTTTTPTSTTTTTTPTTGSTELDQAIRRVLRHGQTIDITTTGRRTRLPRRIEIALHSFDGHLYVSGMPRKQTRAWLHNLRADPKLTVHLKQLIKADLPATAREISDPVERGVVMPRIARVWRRDADEMIEFSPLIEVTIEGFAPADPS